MEANLYFFNNRLDISEKMLKFAKPSAGEPAEFIKKRLLNVPIRCTETSQLLDTMSER